jgi:hypothetical protein
MAEKMASKHYSIKILLTFYESRLCYEFIWLGTISRQLLGAVCDVKFQDNLSKSLSTATRSQRDRKEEGMAST